LNPDLGVTCCAFRFRVTHLRFSVEDDPGPYQLLLILLRERRR
jgi:hypothetical protein